MRGHLLIGFAALACIAAQDVRTLELGGSATAELTQQSVTLYRIAIPADCDSFTLQLSGCPARSPSTNGDGSTAERGADNVKAFISFKTARPTVWESQWSVNWCAPALVFERGQPGFPAAVGGGNSTGASEGNSSAVLHVSVFAAVQARATLVAWRGASELRFGQRLVQQMVMHGVEGPDPNNGHHAPRVQAPSVDLTPLLPTGSITSFFVSKGYGGGGTSPALAAGTFSVRIPPTSGAIVVRLALKNATTYPNANGQRNRYGGSSGGTAYAGALCDLAVALSLTATNLTALPASWGMYAVASGAEQELVIPRTSRAFCRIEPCVLTIQLFAPPSLRNYLARSGDYNPNTGRTPYEYFMCYSPTLDTASHRVEIDVSDAAPPAVDPAKYEISKHAAARSVSIEARGQLAASTCAPGCEQDFVNDGVCHESCITPACRDDGGDCEINGGVYPYCAPGCRRDWLGDGVCDDACFVRECGWDGSDCSRAVRLERYVAAAVAQPASTNVDDSQSTPVPRAIP